jgi:predicted Fe-S protein YdhL (DUF1289 family)
MSADTDDPVVNVPSPCVRNCCLDESDTCLGCYRSIAEILRWGEATDAEKTEILVRCRLRYKQRYEKMNRAV